jgi:hypothetical protein
LFLVLALFVALSMSVVGAIQGSAHDTTHEDGTSELASLGLPELAITVTADGFQAPAEIPAGLVLVTLDNQSEEFGEAQFVQLPAGITVEQFASDLALERDVVSDYIYESVLNGGVAAPPGAQGQAVLNLAPGEWVIANTDSEIGYEPVSISVTGEAVEPAADAVPADLEVELSAYAFDFPDEVATDPQIWQVTNSDPAPHHILLVSYPEPVTAEQVMATLEMDATGTPVAGALDFEQIQDAGLVPALSQGQTTWVAMDLAPGNYIAVCFFADQGSETPHAAMGMIDIFTVK